MFDFWLGVGVGSVMFAAVALPAAWWWRARGQWVNWPKRFIPPPRVGRWQVWGVSAPGHDDDLIGRYRVRWTARIVEWSLTRRNAYPYAYQRFEVRRVR